MTDTQKPNLLERLIVKLTALLPTQALSHNRLILGLVNDATRHDTLPATERLTFAGLDTTAADIRSGPTLGSSSLTPAAVSDDFLSLSDATSHLPPAATLRLGF